MQTDRQTDKAFNWAVTAFNGDILSLEDRSRFPPYVKEVYGGREICKETGREHFQGHISLRNGQRMSALKKWLPTAHLGVARNFNASITYAMKSDTASGEKKRVENPNPPAPNNQEALMMLARVDLSGQITNVETMDNDFWPRVIVILRQEPQLCGLFGKPDIFRLWKHTWSVWIEKAAEETIVLQSPTIISDNSTDASPSQSSSSSSSSTEEAS